MYDILYLILPFLLYSLPFVILTKYSRVGGSIQIAFYRQVGIFLVGLPILFFFPFDLKIFFDNINFILLTSLIGSIYLFINFKSFDYIPVAIGNVFQVSSRIIITILIGILLLGDYLNLYQWVFVFFLLLGIILLLKKEQFKFKGIILSIIGGALLVGNWYFFLKYSTNFNPLIAGYILESVNGIFLFFMLISLSFQKNNSIKKVFQIKKRNFSIILLVSPLVLIASAAVAQSYEIYSFTLVGIFLTMMIPTMMVFGYFILKEKLSIKSVTSIFIITLSIIAIKFFA